MGRAWRGNQEVQDIQDKRTEAMVILRLRGKKWEGGNEEERESVRKIQKRNNSI